MKYLSFILLLSIAASVVRAGTPQAEPVRYIIPSWGDVTLVHGPGTDPAMDTEQAMENMFRHWKARGFTGVFLRTDLNQIPPGKIIRHPAATQPNPALANFWHIVDEILERCDPHMAAHKAAQKVDFEHWMFHPYIYSEGAPADVGVPGPGRMVPWSYMRKYHADHPEVITVDREGNKLWMVAEYAYPGARAEKAAEFAYMAKTFRPTGILASMRSEVSQLIPPPEHGDQFGFNQPVVDDMKRLYGVDIMTDPRFDYKSASYKMDDPMVENWRVLRGTYVTQLYREIRQAMREVDPKIQFAVTLSGDYVGPVLGNWKLDWRTWVDEGIVDVIVMPVTFEATVDLEADKKHYLTDTRAGKGMVPVTEVAAYIAKSKHPEIRIIHTGAPSYFYPPPPAGSDGWQCDAWYDLYTLAFYQRWQQWMGDLKDFGHIKFFEQNFDGFPERGTGASGSYGDGRHHPELHATPGVWYRFGDGSDGKAVNQSEVHHGDSGRAVMITTEDLISRHHSTPDRSRMTGSLDVAITNGIATFDFWLRRDNDKSSLTACFTSDDHSEKDVGVRIEPNSGRLQYATGANQWAGSDVYLKPGQWQQLTIEVNADAQTYSAFMGADKASVICRDIKYAPAEERFITQHGVNVPIKVPAYRTFNVLYFIPEKFAENKVYLDDVSVKWVPTLHYASRGKRVILDETFEDQTPGKPMGKATKTAKWSIEPVSEQAKPLIENTTSYGEGTRCLRAYGGATITAVPSQNLMASAGGKITVDLDVFVRSDKGFPYIIPDPTTRSPHSAVIALAGDVSEKPLASIDTASGTWRLWDGETFVDTGKVVTYDVWQHVQIAVDAKAKTYQLVVQPIGELPSVVGQAAVGPGVKPTERLQLKIKTSDTAGHTSCYDNIMITGN
jgi:hypothetical protein